MILVNRHVDHKIEWYYDDYKPEKTLLQYVLFNNMEFTERFQSIINIQETESFIDEKEDFYGIYHVEDDFEFYTASGFYEFFNENNIDIPYCFHYIRSVKRPINELTFLKFNNYLMREGKRHKTLNVLNTLLFSLEKDYPLMLEYTYKTPIKWKDFFLLFNNITLKTSYNTFYFREDELTQYGNVHRTDYIDMISKWKNKKILFRNINNLLPMFSFYIYRVDKQIFKNTRGKSGKYTFIWKYVATYKRQFLAMFWLAKELRMSPGRAFPDRLIQMLHTFVFFPQKTLIFKVKKFSHNYVYRNCRHTLAEHYRTVTK